uniref:Peptidase M12A domain-containing protein n=1 Tax=Strongyloides stercoralis TaxID=6248 RepID=A0A0K0ESN1_STRER
MLVIKYYSFLLFCAILSFTIHEKTLAVSVKRNYSIKNFRSGIHMSILPGKKYMKYGLQDFSVPVVENSGKNNYGMRKKYDRNCFFSPVQCMTSFSNFPLDSKVGWPRK